MSATVTYKGATLTTATNQTRTLDTAGTYLEDDITITDVTTIPTGTKNISITANGTTTEDVTSYASASITANVPNSYTASDEGKVVSNGSLVSQTSATYTANDTYDTTTVSSVTVNVSGGGGNALADYLNHNLTGSYVYTPDYLTGITLQGQNGITSLSFPNLTSLANVATYAFSGISGLLSFSAPKALRQSGSMLMNDTALTSVNLDALVDTGANLLYGCNQLESIVLPSVQAIYSQTFRNCSKLKVLDVLASNGFTNQNNMNGCSVLDTLIIRKNGVASLSNVNNFASTPFASGGSGGTIYVPSAQLANYKAATNWSTLDGYGTITWVAIEGSYYETHYGDGRTIS